MLYLSGGDGKLKIIVLETKNIEELLKGRPAHSPDNSVLIAWTPDAEWLAQQINNSKGDASKISAAIDAASKRPEKPVRPYHEMKVVDLKGE